MGVVIAPPVPAFYAKPTSLDELVDYTVVRLLDQIGLHGDVSGRWSGLGDDSTAD
jgi:4-hydroxy-3-polyprenylbenzoate decarboxylase